MLENKIIQSESNFIATVKLLKNDMFLYHRKEEELFKDSNYLNYYIAIKYDNKLYNTNIAIVRQFKEEYSFNNAIEKALQILDKNAIDGSFNDYLDKFIITVIDKGLWLYKWLFSIVKDYDIKNNTNYYKKALHNRQLKLEENERKEQQRKEEYAKREEERKAKEEEEKRLKDIENFCNGFTDNKSPMQQQRIANTLNKLVRVNGVVMQRKENVLNKLNAGYEPKIKPLYNKNDILKDNLVLENKDGWFIELTKTEYDYALYLLNELGLENAKFSKEVN